ncbi:MAG TPA: Pls/PosA family non-ribosomal peptide synthetase [Hyphomicrobiaceae bacterium]|nr:Pls/PosA family non-ribosomal peptide synthetase [Hyphomicrobiaceae bacterium]
MVPSAAEVVVKRGVGARGAPLLLHEHFETQALLRGDHPAVECAGEMLTYAELDVLANRIAHALRRRGVRTGDLVGIYLSKSTRLFAALLGVLKAGAGYVPIDAKFPLERIRDILADSGASALITEGELADALPERLPAPLLRLDAHREEIAAQPCTGLPASEIGLTAENLCYVIYTSGSTGRPKGVMIEHRNANAFLAAFKAVYGLTSADRIYQGFSTAFDASVEEIWGAFSIGATLVVPTECVARSPLDVADFLTANRVTYFSTVPTFLSMIDRELPTVRVLVLGGEVCSSDLVARWAKPGRRMLNTYGPTEATVVATWAECRPGRPVTIGVAMPGYETYVLDDAMRPVKPGEEGELYIGGPAVARGYLNRPELTAERFIKNPLKPCSIASERLYRTHDLVRLTETGELQFLGRADGQIKIRGFRVELSEIEAVLTQHSAIRAAAVAVVDTGGLSELAAYVVAERELGDEDRAAIAELLRSRLPDYMVPKFLDRVSALPLMTSGKIDRKRLPPPVAPLMGTARHIVAAADELERAIVSAWEAALGVSPISVDDDFFLDLGGHSLLAAKAVTLLRAKLNSSRPSVRDIYKHPTVRALAQHFRDIGVTGRAALSAAANAERQTRSRAAFCSVHWLERWSVVALQALALVLYYGLVAAPFAYSVLITTAVVDGHLDLGDAIWISTAVGFAAWPSMLLFSIALKWLVIGRYRPGHYPVWSFYYFRWWLVSRFQALSWSYMFVGTPLMSLYYRAMGAKVGKGVVINTPLCTTFDTVSIGDHASIGSETQLLGYRVENGVLTIGRIDIGSDCFIGMHCCLGLDTRMGDGARLDDMSLLADGMHMERGEGRRGTPAMPAEVPVPGAAVRTLRPRRAFLYGLAHLLLIYAMGYFLILTMLPAVALIGGALIVGGPLWGIGAAFLSVPVSILWYMLAVILLKRLATGRIEHGIYRLESGAYLRHWFLDYLMRNTRAILLPLYATVYFPPFLRLLGARIGKDVEISTVTQISPDLLSVGHGSFLADACLVGGERIHRGLAEIRPVAIGERTFVGNSAMVAGGHVLGSNVLIGVMSTPPAEWTLVPPGTRWLGSPGFALPRTQSDACFAETDTFAPGKRARRTRAFIDAMRVSIPGIVLMASLVGLAAAMVAGYRTLPLWAVIGALPVAATLLAALSIGAAALIKRLLIGRIEPVVKPLWSPFVWFNELVNGVYESVAAPIMAPMLGTPFVAPALRAMGCRIGKWCFIETTLFSEFDLVEIGDHAALNLGATVQTHLFEDRIFKADHLRLGEGASVGNMSVVLYGTDMGPGSSLGPLSVLMKGERLPPSTRWSGIPCEQIAAEPVRPRPWLPRRGTRQAPIAVRASV